MLRLIATTAAQSTGKTTLLNSLNQNHGHSVVARKSSRSIQSEWNVTLDQINSDNELTIKFQNEILRRKLADDMDTYDEVQCRYTPLQSPLLFTERSPVDLFTYALLALGRVPRLSSWVDDYYTQCVESISAYDHIIYIEGGKFPAVAEEQRASTNLHYTKLVDTTMRSYYDEMVPKNKQIIISTTDLNERCEQVLNAIR
jgi:predicted ATPase